MFLLHFILSRLIKFSNQKSENQQKVPDRELSVGFGNWINLYLLVVLNLEFIETIKIILKQPPLLGAVFLLMLFFTSDSGQSARSECFLR